MRCLLACLPHRMGGAIYYICLFMHDGGRSWSYNMCALDQVRISVEVGQEWD